MRGSVHRVVHYDLADEPVKAILKSVRFHDPFVSLTKVRGVFNMQLPRRFEQRSSFTDARVGHPAQRFDGYGEGVLSQGESDFPKLYFHCAFI